MSLRRNEAEVPHTKKGEILQHLLKEHQGLIWGIFFPGPYKRSLMLSEPRRWLHCASVKQDRGIICQNKLTELLRAS